MFIRSLSILLFILIFVACGTNKEERAEKPQLLQVYTSMYPLYDFTQKIGGDHVAVYNMMPAGVEGHDFEPKPKDIAALHDADLFIYNGAGYESWAEKVMETLDTGRVHVLNTTEGLPLLTNEESGHVHDDVDDRGHEDEHGAVHDDEEFDPHVWLDPQLAKLQAQAIKDALVNIDRENAETYEANYEELAQQFDQLDMQLKAVVQQAERKEIVVSHAAFGYLTKAYGLKQIPISGFSPSHEPSQKELQKIIEFANEYDVQYILYETIVSSKLAETVKNEIGAEALTLNSLENLTKEEFERGEDFFSVMQKNIDNLETALSSRR